MKVNYKLDNNNCIVGYVIIPFNPLLPAIEVESEAQIHIGISQVIDGVFLENNEAYQEKKAQDTAIYAIKNEIAQLKRQLQSTDYEAIKFAEGAMSAENYEPYRVQRAAWRARINELENQLEN